MNGWCDRCGLCCMVFDVEVTEDELNRICTVLPPDVEKRFMEKVKRHGPNFYWINPCPLLKKVKEGEYECMVHEVKPKQCRDWTRKDCLRFKKNFKVVNRRITLKGIKIDPQTDLDPASDYSVQWATFGSGTGHYDRVAKGSGNTNGIEETTEGDIDWFTLEDLPAGATAVNWVNIHAIAQALNGEKAGEDIGILDRLSDGGTIRDFDQLVSRTGFTEYNTGDYTTDPDLASWTVAKVNGMHIGVEADRVGAGETLQVSELWAVVDYEAVLTRSASAAMSLVGAAKRSAAFSRYASASMGTAAVAKRLKAAVRKASAAVSTAANTAREIVVSRAKSAAMSLTAAAKAAKLFTRFATATMSLVAAAKRLPLFLRAKSAAVSFAGVAKRELVAGRSAAASMSLTGATARLREVSREASAAMSLVAVAIREALFPRSASATISTSAVALRKKMATRAASASVSLAGVAKGFKAFFREASASMSLVAATAKQVLYKRGVTGAVSLAGNTARQAVLSRAASASIGASAAAKGFKAFFRKASGALSLAAATAREIVVSRTAPASVQMVGAAARQAVLSRLASASMGLTGATARVKRVFRSAAASMSATGATARSIIVSRLASSSMGVVASAKRTYLASRLASAVMGLMAAAKGTLTGVMLAPPVQATLRMIPQEATLRLPPASLTTRLLTASKTPLLMGGGELVYTPLQTVSRLVLPADYANQKLWFWNQHSDALAEFGNPWKNKQAWVNDLFIKQDVASMLINSGTSVNFHAIGGGYGTPRSCAFPLERTEADRFNWFHDKAAHKFSFDFYLDNDLEETDPTVLIDDGGVAFWNMAKYGSGTLDFAESDDTTEKVKGNDSYAITENGGGVGSYSGVRWSHAYEPNLDWSDQDFVCFYWYGFNSGVTWYVEVWAPNTSNIRYWRWVDNWTGWKRLVLPLRNPTGDIGSPDLSDIDTIRFSYYLGTIPTGQVICRLDRTLVDVGQWVKVEVYVPDQLLLAHPDGNERNCFLYSWSGATWKNFLRWSATGSWQYVVRTYNVYLDGSSLEELYGTTGDPSGYIIGEREETKNRQGGDGPSTITYSSYYGCLKRIGFAIKMPPDDGQDASDAGISQVKLKLEVYYEGELTVEDTTGDNDGTRYGALPDETGTALVFDGVDDYVQIPNDPSWKDLTEFTVLMGIKPTNASMLYGTPLFYCESYNFRGWQVGYWYDDDRLFLRVNSSEGWSNVQNNVPLTVDVRSLIGISLDSDLNVKHWKDGNQIGSTKTVAFAPDPASKHLDIYNETGNASAEVDMILIYDRVLSDWEHQLVFQGNAPRYGLVSEWKLDDDWDFGRTTYEFEDSLNQYYGLQNINEDWLCLFHEATGVVEFLTFGSTPTGLKVRADENEEIDQLTLTFPSDGNVYSEEVSFPDLTTDTDVDGVPDFLEAFPPFELPDYIPVTLRRVR